MDSRPRIGLVLLLVGLAGVLSPLALYEFHDQRYSVNEATTGTVFPRGDTIESAVAFEDLSETERRAVDPEPESVPEYVGASSAPARWDVFSEAEWQRADGLRTHEYVEYEGAYYRIEVDRFVATERFVGAAMLAVFLPYLGAIAAVLGAIALVIGSIRPFTPGRALWLPVGVFAALFAVGLFRTLTFGGGSAPGLPLDGLLVGVVAFAVIGSALARRDRPWAVGSAVALLSLVAYRVALDPYVWSRSAPGIVAAGLPFLVLGYLLTDRGGDGSTPPPTTTPT